MRSTRSPRPPLMITERGVARPDVAGGEQFREHTDVAGVNVSVVRVLGGPGPLAIDGLTKRQMRCPDRARSLAFV